MNDTHSPVEPSLPTSEERVLAALAHVGIIANIFNLIGIVGAVLIWFFQQKKSQYVASHALQALVFQVLTVVIYIPLFLMWVGSMVLSLLPAIRRPDLYPSDWPFLFWLVLVVGMVILLLFALVVSIYGLVGAYTAWRGRPFRYGPVQRFILLHQVSTSQSPDVPGQWSDTLPDERAAD
jgi:uncharacterized Tic20 family protein